MHHSGNKKQKKSIKTILISNDDGIDAKGLNKLAQALRDRYRILISAPSKEQSAMGHGITVRWPLTVYKINDETYSVKGTPADSVRCGLAELFDCDIDLVISGINHGMNIGWDVYYSGTVAAARESIMKQTPAIAVSIQWTKDEKWHFDTVCYYLLDILHYIEENPVPNDILLNINVPNIPVNEVKGIKITKLAHRYYKEKISLEQEELFSYKAKFHIEPIQEKAKDTDYNALMGGFISITPIKLDATDYEFLNAISSSFPDELNIKAGELK